MNRTRAWLVVSPVIAAGVLVAHALAYRLTATPTDPFHEYLALSPDERSGRTAFITVHFLADIAAVTRDAEGNVVAGTLTDAVTTNDNWTFSRNLKDSDPNWLLVETDEAA